MAEHPKFESTGGFHHSFVSPCRAWQSLASPLVRGWTLTLPLLELPQPLLTCISLHINVYFQEAMQFEPQWDLGVLEGDVCVQNQPVDVTLNVRSCLAKLICVVNNERNSRHGRGI